MAVMLGSQMVVVVVVMLGSQMVVVVVVTFGTQAFDVVERRVVEPETAGTDVQIGVPALAAAAAYQEGFGQMLVGRLEESGRQVSVDTTERRSTEQVLADLEKEAASRPVLDGEATEHPQMKWTYQSWAVVARIHFAPVRETLMAGWHNLATEPQYDE